MPFRLEQKSGSRAADSMNRGRRLELPECVEIVQILRFSLKR